VPPAAAPEPDPGQVKAAVAAAKSAARLQTTADALRWSAVSESEAASCQESWQVAKYYVSLMYTRPARWDFNSAVLGSTTYHWIETAAALDEATNPAPSSLSRQAPPHAEGKSQSFYVQEPGRLCMDRIFGCFEFDYPHDLDFVTTCTISHF
jgi:hypothetical protein